LSITVLGAEMLQRFPAFKRGPKAFFAGFYVLL
jgi:hypothetical protein